MADSPCADKGSSGSALCRAKRCLTCLCSGKENCPPMLCGSVASRRLEMLADISTGSLWSHSSRRNLWPKSRLHLDPPSMPSCPDLVSQTTTSGKKTPAWMVPGSGAQNPFKETLPPIGSRYGNPLSPETYYQSRLVYEWSVIGPLGLLAQISRSVRQLFAKYSYFGELPRLESPAVPGMKRAYRLTLKIQDPNSGMAIKIRRMLCLMNFGAELISRTYCDGQTVILSEWRLREAQDPYLPKNCGSLQTLTPESGIPSWI